MNTENMRVCYSDQTGRFALQVALILSSLLIPVVCSGTTLTVTQIRSAITDYLINQVSAGNSEMEIGRIGIDNRLNLPECTLPLVIDTAPGQPLRGNTTLGVRCQGVQPWTVYVPVEIRLLREVLVSSRPLRRNTTISATDLIVEKRDISKIRTMPITDMTEAIGQVTRFHIAQGMVLSENLLELPTLVTRGQQVTILAQGPGLTISATGVALVDGVMGELVSARNLLSNKTISGVVTGSGVIEVNP
jgi:flagella basal body P-ring formation protein FlgA